MPNLEINMKTKFLIFLISLSLLVSLVPFNFAQAQVGLVATAIGGVFATLFGLICNIAGTITGAFLGMAVAIFNWVCSENFISLSYTNAGLSPGDPHFNQFLFIGWHLTRDLTNIFFVIALVAIGLGTALRLSGYQMQKALPTLIIIALLVNFTPVICGLIVDASNIVMNFFIQGGFASGNSFVNYAVSQWSNIGSLVGGLKFWDPTSSQEAVSAAAGSMVLIWFNLIAALVYLLFALIFVLRYIAIWILVILSPFAFACRILPATKNVWDMWWKNFIQWSIIGVIAGFFLYLGDHFIRTATTAGFLQGSMGQVASAPGLSGIINSILPYFISLILLSIGFFLSLSFAPKGADSIMKAAQKGGNAAGKVVGFAAAGAAWKTTKATAKAPFRFVRGFTDYQKTAKAGRVTLGGRRPISPGLILEEGLETEAIRQPRPSTGQKMATSIKEVGKATSAGLREAGFRDFKGKSRAASKGTWKAIKGAAVAGGAAALGIKLKKQKGPKGKKEKMASCPTCGKEIAESASACPKCGAKFESS